MYDYAPIFVPSNLEKTWLNIRIWSGAGKYMRNPCELGYGLTNRKGVPYHAERSCSITVGTAIEAQQAISWLSRQYKKEAHVSSDRLYFLPLFKSIDYMLTVDPSRKSDRPTMRIEDEPKGSANSYLCKIHASNLFQMQTAVFAHEGKIFEHEAAIIRKHLRDLQRGYKEAGDVKAD